MGPCVRVTMLILLKLVSHRLLWSDAVSRCFHQTVENMLPLTAGPHLAFALTATSSRLKKTNSSSLVCVSSVVYEHRSRLEKSLQKERLEHKKAKEGENHPERGC